MGGYHLSILNYIIAVISVILTAAPAVPACTETYFLALSLSPCARTDTASDVYYDCYDRDIDDALLDPTWFSCRITTLNLDRNALTSLSNTTLPHVTSLTSLSLRWNKIAAIDPGAFDGLQYLQHINLDFNSLSLPGLPTGLFDDAVLPALQTLKLSRQEENAAEGNTMCYAYRSKWVCSSDEYYYW